MLCAINSGIEKYLVLCGDKENVMKYLKNKTECSMSLIFIQR